MSYRCGIDSAVAKMIGDEPGGPRIACDACGLTLEIVMKRGQPPAWLRDCKAAPGWLLVDNALLREDYCPACKKRMEAVAKFAKAAQMLDEVIRDNPGLTLYAAGSLHLMDGPSHEQTVEMRPRRDAIIASYSVSTLSGGDW